MLATGGSGTYYWYAVANTAYVDAADSLKSNINSPTFTGVPTLPTGTVAVTQTAVDSSTKLATTAFVQANKTTFNTRSGAVTLSSGDVTSALGFTPLSTSGKAADADLLDGLNSAYAGTPNTVALRDVNGDITARVFIGVATSARYADLAEKYTTDKHYPVGTVMVVSLDENAECTQSFMDTQLAVGVISENPAYLMNSESSGQAIALKGRVPVRVVGVISKGQTLVASSNGTAMYGAVNPIAIALETSLTPGEKLIECVIV